MGAEVVQIFDVGDYDEQIHRASSILKSGGIVVLPTETVYGAAAVLNEPKGLLALRALPPQAAAKPLTIYPADPTVKMPDGTTGYPETVLLRLISSTGRPHIKIAASEDGSGMVLGGESDPAYIQLLARGTNTSVKMINKDGREQVIKP